MPDRTIECGQCGTLARVINFGDGEVAVCFVCKKVIYNSSTKNGNRPCGK